MAKTSLKEFLAQGRPAVMDGAMATALYERGYYINRSFEELSLTDPKGVKEVIQDFKNAGAKFLTTNTFSATKPKLTEFGLQDHYHAILQASAQLALEVAGDDSYVLGLIGPLPVMIDPFGPTAFIEAIEMYEETVRVLEEAGVDGFSIAGFHNIKNLEAALIAVKKMTQKPVFAQLSLNEDMRSSYGHTPEDLVTLADNYGAEVIGFCGEVGPSGMFTALEHTRKLTNKPICLRPNAGLPKYVNDQWIYLCNPDYLAKYSKRYVQNGALLVGGHCGVFPDHIKAVANSLRMTQHLVPHTNVYSELIRPLNNDEATETKSLKNRSELGKALASKERIFSIEILPPNGVDTKNFMGHCQKLKSGGVKFVNIPDGARAMARMSSLHLAAYVQKHFGLEAIPHLTTRDRNIIGLQSDLLGTHVAGIRNILLVTGDPPKLGNIKGASGVYDVDAIGLTHIAARMNRGVDLGGSSFGSPTEFCIGVALNPTAPYHELEISRYRYKAEAGADFAMTQPIYDVEAYLRFMDQVQDVDIPIVMGVWPLVSLRNAEFLKNEVPGVSVPDWVLAEMEKAKDNKEDAVKRGIEIAIKTMNKAKDLVAGFQVSAPFNRVNVSLEVIHAISN